MILAKLAELAMCRISGEEEVDKLGGLQPPEPPCFLRQCIIICVLCAGNFILT